MNGKTEHRELPHPVAHPDQHGSIPMTDDRKPDRCVRHDCRRALAESRAEVSGLRAARMAYASEFPLNADGEPDVGNVHANIRALKARAERLAAALLNVLPYVEHADHCGDCDSYNNADWPTCGCGLGSTREEADAALNLEPTP